MKFVVLIIIFVSSLCEASAARAKIDQKLTSDLALSMSLLTTPDQALQKYKSRLKPEEVTYLKDLIAKKLWLEMPQIRNNKNKIFMTFSNKQTLEVRVKDYWSADIYLDDYKLEYDNYPTVQERFAYLRRVLQRKTVNSEVTHRTLLDLFINQAYASLTCNAVISSGCLEVSMAASLWLVRASLTDAPISRCKDNYFKNVGNAKKCMEQYKNLPTLTAIQDISEMLAEMPKTSLEIKCNKSEGPTILINGTEVTRTNRGLTAEDYSLNSEQDKDYKLRKLPEAALRCCKRSDSDPLTGLCEAFVNDNLGNVEKRKAEFKNPDVRFKGKELKGVR